jgi:hypothetical protein
MYADDLKLYKVVSNYNDCMKLQTDIYNIEKWCKTNHLEVNIDKCKFIRYTKCKKIIECNYKIKNQIIEQVQNFRDLGVIFDEQLSFNHHIELTVSNALKVLGFITRNSKLFFNLDSIKCLFNFLVRTKLEYASLVWGPIYNVHIDKLEKVQKKFLKYLYFKHTKSYPNRDIAYNNLLHQFQFESLGYRRIVVGVKFLYKLINNHIDVKELLELIAYNVPQANLRNQLLFKNNIARTVLGTKSPIYMICNNFNKICEKCDPHFDKLSKILNVTSETFKPTG